MPTPAEHSTTKATIHWRKEPQKTIRKDTGDRQRNGAEYSRQATVKVGELVHRENRHGFEMAYWRPPETPNKDLRPTSDYLHPLLFPSTYFLDLRHREDCEPPSAYSGAVKTTMRRYPYFIGPARDTRMHQIFRRSHQSGTKSRRDPFQAGHN